MKIEDRIKLLVKSKGLKMEFVYTSIGMSGPGFYKMLKNETYSVAMLQKIADVLGVSIVYFFEKPQNLLQRIDDKLKIVDGKSDKEIKYIQSRLPKKYVFFNVESIAANHRYSLQNTDHAINAIQHLEQIHNLIQKKGRDAKVNKIKLVEEISEILEMYKKIERATNEEGIQARKSTSKKLPSPRTL